MVVSAVARGRGTAVSVVSAAGWGRFTATAVSAVHATATIATLAAVTAITTLAAVTAITTAAWTMWITTTGGRVLYSNLVREESREGAADCVLLERRLGIAR